LIKAMVNAVKNGSKVEDVLTLGERIVKDSRIYFVVDTLKYLHMGGRIGGASAFLGSALDLKPILTLSEEGKIDALEKVRTKKKAVKRLIELTVEKAGGKPAFVGIIHAEAREDAEMIKAELESQINCLDSEIYIISPVIGTHTGPGALAVGLHTVTG